MGMGASARRWSIVLVFVLAGCGDNARSPQPVGGDAGDPLVCSADRCGDGILDPGESCDDGNDTPLDGCAACAMVACGSGRSVFDSRVNATVGDYRLALVVAGDFGGDGRPDLFGWEPDFAQLRSALQSNEGFGEGGPLPDLEVWPAPVSLVVSDLDGQVGDEAVVQGQAGDSYVVGFTDGMPTLLDHRVGLGASAPCDVDFDGDADLLAVMPGDAEPALVSAANDGGGSFGAFGEPLTALDGTVGPYHLDCVDMDDDGDQDVMVESASALQLVRQGADGFDSIATVSPGESHLVVDLDGDGLPDIVRSDGTYSHNLDGAAFAEPTPFPAATWIDSGDIDGDGDVDLVATDRILYNLGEGDFASRGYDDLSAAGHHLADLDQDGDLDILSWTGRLIENLGAGRFLPPSLPGAQNAEHVTVADLDADGSPEIFTTGSKQFAVTDLGGALALEAEASTLLLSPDGARMEWSVPVDLDCDGDVDIAVSDEGNQKAGGIHVLINDGAGAFAHEKIAESSGAEQIITAHLDEDSFPDLAWANRQTDTIEVLFGDGVQVSVELGGEATNPESLVAADLDGDGDSDIAAAGEGDGMVYLIYNQGSRDFIVEEFDVIGQVPQAMAAGDLDGDGRMDLVVGGDWLRVLYRREEGYLVGGFLEAAGSVRQVVIADLDGDLDLDLAASGPTTGAVTLLANDGVGNFTASIWPAAVASSQSDEVMLWGLAAAHLDDDCMLDVLVTLKGPGPAGGAARVWLTTTP